MVKDGGSQKPSGGGTKGTPYPPLEKSSENIQTIPTTQGPRPGKPGEK